MCISLIATSYNNINNTTTFTQYITTTKPGNGTNGTFKDLSHGGFLNPCLPSSEIIGGGAGYTTNDKCKPGVPVIKFDAGTYGTNKATFTLVRQRGYSLAFTDPYFKAGTSCFTGKVYTTKCCLFQVSCPTNKNLENFNCTNLNAIPALRATLNSLRAAPYNLIIETSSCGVIKFKVGEDKLLNIVTWLTKPLHV